MLRFDKSMQLVDFPEVPEEPRRMSMLSPDLVLTEKNIYKLASDRSKTQIVQQLLEPAKASCCFHKQSRFLVLTHTNHLRLIQFDKHAEFHELDCRDL